MQLPATAELAQASTLVRAIEATLAAEAGALVIDASPLQRFDTSAIAVLLQGRRLATVAGRGFEVRGAPEQLVQLAQLYGVEGLLAFASASAPPSVSAPGAAEPARTGAA